MPRSVTVGSVEIEQANDYGPDGRAPIRWRLSRNVGGRRIVDAELSGGELLELLIALKAWREANQ